MYNEDITVRIRKERIAVFEQLIEKLKKHPRKIVFTEGTEPRILEAAARLKEGGYVFPVLVGEPNAVRAAAQAGGFDIEGVEICDPYQYPRMEEMVNSMFQLRKGKMTVEECQAALHKGNYFGTMLVKMGEADCLLGGATYSTADTVRPALQLIKTRPGFKSVSSCFLLVRPCEDGSFEQYIMGDCAINIDPDADEMAECAVECANTARLFGIEPRVALLSYSTKGSGKGETVDKVRKAAEKVHDAAPDLIVDGEVQFDAAFSPVVAKVKCKDSPLEGKANVFIFPDINAGNIGYKIGARLGGFKAYGPILQGLNAPINDLSRGCDADEVYMMSIITAGVSDI